MTIRLKRTTEPPAKSDGARVLVDRLWPRGKSKAALRLTLWLREAAPSTELRRWFDHQPPRWAEFQRRYAAELRANPAVLEPLRELLRLGPVTLVYASAETRYNNAVALKEYVEGEQVDTTGR